VHRARIICAAAAAVGGILGAAALPAAVADADPFDVAAYTIDPIGPETVTGLYNVTTAPPGVNESLQGYGLFDVLSDDPDDPVGRFSAYISTVPYLAFRVGTADQAIVSSETLYVGSDVPGYEDPTGIAPTEGTVIALTHSFGGFFSNLYSADGTTVTDILRTPFGDIDFSQLVNSLGFDAANVPSVLPDEITAISDPVITGVNGLPPLTIAMQGYQAFQFGDDPDATFNAVQTTTTDGLGFHTEAFLVTEETGAADSLPVGSIYNTVDFMNLSNVYSSIPQENGFDKVTDILIDTNTGQSLDLSLIFGWFNASAGLDDGSFLRPIELGDDVITAAPNSDFVFTGINGLPPGNVAIQGDGLFALYENGADSPTSIFGADVTTVQPMLYSFYTETLLVTDSMNSALPIGSVIDYTSYGFGFENLYTDLPGMGADGENLITDIFSTPFGDMDLSWIYASLDASAGLTPAEGLASFADQPWLELFQTVFGL
jgi:hypothetical protein